MDVYSEIKKLIEGAVKALGLEEGVVNLDHPTHLSFGDITTNVALICAKEAGESPKALAEKIIANLKSHPFVQEVKIAGPGFINFYLSAEFFRQNLVEILKQKKDYGLSQKLAGKKVIIEYTDPNPFKEFHIGHLMSNTIGEALSRIVESQGAETRRACYQGDVGLHVAKTIWGLMKKGTDSASVKNLGEAYAYGATEYEKNGVAKKEIVEINKKVYEQSDKNINQLYTTGRQASLDYFETIYQKLGTKFDDYFFESETGPLGKKLVEKNIGTVFEKSDGAVVYNGEAEGLHTRVFINSQGLPTYEAKELSLAKLKYDKFKYDQSLVISANEITAYFKVLLSALGKIYPDLAPKTIHLPHGMLRLPSGKMSSRTGDVISAEDLLNEVKAKVADKMADKEIPNQEAVIHDISVGAIKYSILKQDMKKDIIFDFDTSLSFEGNSGPYLQYVYVRTQSILAKANFEETKIGQTEKIYDLERLLYRFPFIVSRAYAEYAPHYICTYLYLLAGEYNSLYAEEKFIGGDNENLLLGLTKAVGTVLQNGLNLLGINTPERM